MTGETMNASSISRRNGLTLLEVLITIFVMGIGMLSVLTLFPLAARKISMAIDMDRASQMAANADAMATIPILVTAPGTYQSIKGAAAQFFTDQVNALAPTDANLARPSMVIHYDLPGDLAGTTATWLSNVSGAPNATYSPNQPGTKGLMFPNNLSIQPRITNTVGSGLKRDQVVSLDEYPFDDVGQPENGSRRAERYTSSYLFRRNRLDDKKSMDMVILVYAGRPLDFGNFCETYFNLTTPSVASSTTITLPNTLVSPSGPDRLLRPGSWIMDISLQASTNRPAWKSFYKVQSIDGLTVTLDRPLDTNMTDAVWIDYMVDWFDRGTCP
jgi:prepilin-type N-terminal cleavage/methylation domain-containing protein